MRRLLISITVFVIPGILGIILWPYKLDNGFNDFWGLWLSIVVIKLSIFGIMLIIAKYIEDETSVLKIKS